MSRPDTDLTPNNTVAAAVVPGGEALLGRVRDEAAGATRARFALGYLSVAGLLPVWDALETVTTLHLLIGNTAAQPTDEQRAAQNAQAATQAPGDVAAPAREQRTRVVTETAHALEGGARRLGETEPGRRVLLGLAAGIGAGRIRVRVYTGGRIHAKAYLFERAHADSVAGNVALVGSSNLTLPGVAADADASPAEMNVLLRDADAVADVAAWFERLWNAGHEFSRDLLLLLSGAAQHGGANAAEQRP